DFDVDVEILRIVIQPMPLLRVHQLIHPDVVTVGYHLPVVAAPVDARNLICWKLKDLEGHVLTLQPHDYSRGCRHDDRQGHHSSYHGQASHQIKPRFDKLVISAIAPNDQGETLSERLTEFTSEP